ncbi:glycoside hydrolase family 6 protein [Patulibacter sp. SYSU D01012]|uniref:glycoside hydrolase family 6 protein n=1 Tax=Patulibacter sp. SYSU D01012 TaxID=2817381 RepID=UPI001B30DF9D
MWAAGVVLALLAGAAPAAAAPADPFAGGHRPYRDPDAPAARQAAEWRASRPGDARLMERIARRPVARWLTDPGTDASGAAGELAGRARAADEVPVVVVYGLPQRDCGASSAGGAGSAAAYRRWVRGIAAGLAGGRAAVVLEPDAVAGWDCLQAPDRARRATLLRGAVRTLAGRGVAVYLDAGHGGWRPAAEMARRLRRSGVARARGVAVNVSNYRTTAESARYLRALRVHLRGLHGVIDTSRNGRGPAPGGAWCNPPGRGLGAAPTVRPRRAGVDALLWIKAPGESDGPCNGGPPAGQWWPEGALDLARRAR